MEFAFTEEEETLLQEFRAFLKDNITPELHAEIRILGNVYGGQESRKLGRKMGRKDGLLPIGRKNTGV